MPFFKTLSLAISQVGLFWQEKVNGQIFRWNIIFILCQVAILFIKFNNLPPQIPLFYSLPWGESQIASVSSIFILPVLSIVIMLLNNFLAVFFLKSSKLLSRILVVVSLICSVFATIAIFEIISLVS
jgi:hypothetical protein